MPKKKDVPYLYGQNDTPVSVANQYGITPQELINANPGGWPFQTGQNIVVPQPITFQERTHSTIKGIAAGVVNAFNAYDPSQYQTPLEAQYAGQYPTRPDYLTPRGVMGQPWAAEAYNAPVLDANGRPIGLHGTFGQTIDLTQPQPQYIPNNYNVAQRGRGYGPAPTVTTNNTYGGAGVPPVGYGPQQFAPQQAPNYGPGYVPTAGAIVNAYPWLAGTQPTATPNTSNAAAVSAGDYANTKAAQYYDANNVPLMKQLRYDPQTRKYVSVGRLLRQGKLDLQGNWHRQSNRQRITAAVNRQRAQQQQQQNYTMSNSLIDFNASSG